MPSPSSNAILIARSLAYTVSGFHRYVRVNDFIIDTVESEVVAMAYPRMEPGAFPIRKKADSIAEVLL